MSDHEFTVPFPGSASTGDTHGFPLAPAWHDKPTCVGMWLQSPNMNKAPEGWMVVRITPFDLDPGESIYRGRIHSEYSYYGPIQEDKR